MPRMIVDIRAADIKNVRCFISKTVHEFGDSVVASAPYVDQLRMVFCMN